MAVTGDVTRQDVFVAGRKFGEERKAVSDKQSLADLVESTMAPVVDGAEV